MFSSQAQLEAWIILNLKLKLLFSKLQYQYQDHLASLLATARLLETGTIFCADNDHFSTEPQTLHSAKCSQFQE